MTDRGGIAVPLHGGTSPRCEVTLYPMPVNKLRRRWKERAVHDRHWFAPKKAAKMVAEKEVSQLLMELVDKPQRRAAIDKLHRAA